MATKFYLRAPAQSSFDTLPASNVSVSATSPTQIGDSGTNRSAELLKGAAQTSIVITTNGTANAQPSLIGRFVSDPISAQTIGSQAINISIGGAEANAGSNFLVRFAVALWRPSTGASVGLLTDLTNATLEPGTSETSLTATTASSTSQTAIDGDVLVFEVWRDSTVPGATTARTNTIFFDGTTEASTSTNAAFINFGTTTIKFLGDGFAQAQADVKAISRGFGQSQTDIEATANQFAQTQSILIGIHTAFGQTQSDIKSISQGYGQTQADVKNIGQQFAQTQADIKAISNQFGQSNADIKQISNISAQSNADIKAVSLGFGQGNADIKNTSLQFAQAQSDINAVSNQFAQSNTDIKQIGTGFGQSQGFISGGQSTFGQANALNGSPINLYTFIDEASLDTSDYIVSPAGTSLYYEAKLTDIPIPEYKQDHILRINMRFTGISGAVEVTLRQSTSVIFTLTTAVTSSFVTYEHVLTTAEINSILDYSDLSVRVAPTLDSTSRINVSWIEFQAPKGTHKAKWGQAQALIENLFGVTDQFAHAQARIKTTYQAYGQTNSHIKITSNAFGQAASDIKQIYAIFAQANAEIKTTYFGFGQAQSEVKAVSLEFAQAQAYLKVTNNVTFAQAQATIRGNAYSQANADIVTSYQSYANAQALIRITVISIAQAQAQIKQTYTSTGNTQTHITVEHIEVAQAEALLRDTDISAFAQALGLIIKAYGAGQAQALIAQPHTLKHLRIRDRSIIGLILSDRVRKNLQDRDRGRLSLKVQDRGVNLYLNDIQRINLQLIDREYD